MVRVGGIWTLHSDFGWQVRVNTFELVDRLDRRGIVAFLVAYTTHLVRDQATLAGMTSRKEGLGPKRALIR